jgi:hypothetical protein
MKNIHLLPTDKASRLKQNKITKKYSLVTKGIDLTMYTPQNIYITDDEEIKVGDWTIATDGGWKDTITKITGTPITDVWKKIILTTDPDLIKDGVQAIDDEFLEWFVKNPSCEFVQTLWTIPAYKIEKEYRIEIPKEEPKQHLEYINNNIEEFEGKLKEFKQVTSIDWLEKQLDNNDFSNHQMEVNISMSLPKYIEIFKQSKEMYNQERMYSEEDLKQSYSQGWMTRERFDDLSPEIVYPDGLDYEEKQEYAFNLWFNQFKKK